MSESPGARQSQAGSQDGNATQASGNPNNNGGGIDADALTAGLLQEQ
jgi:hypothetical protein